MPNIKHESPNLLDQILATDEARNICALAKESQAAQVGIANNVISADLCDDVQYDEDIMTAALELTTINSEAELKTQTVEVDYLKSDQWLMIPSGLGINPVMPSIGRENPRPELITRYWQITRMSYDWMKELMQQNTPAATVLAEIATLESTPATSLFADWGIGPPGGEADPKSVIDNVYMFVSKNAEMNFDVRDMGILNADNMSVTDVAWKNLNDFTSDRLNLKINEYSMQQLAALNLVPCAGSKLAAWTRAYGVGCGIMPHPTSRMMIEYCWTDSFAKQEDVRDCLAWEKEKCSGKPMNVICLNVIGLFGLLHLNKDRTFRNNDRNMNRIFTSWLNTLDSITTKKMQNEILNQKEALCRIAAHPFGLAQTYWLAQVLGRTNMLASKLALRVDTSPPPVQRFMICDATFSGWGKLATGQEVNSIYQKKIELILEGVDLVRKCPPAFSELYKFYGLDEKNDLRKEISEALGTLMPAVFGYAKSKHGDKRIAMAMSFHSVKRECGEVIINWWTKKWNMDEGKKANPTSTCSSIDGYLG